MTSKVTREERAATRSSGRVDPKVFDAEPEAQQDQDVLTIEELATLYIDMMGQTGRKPDPRAVALFEAGKKAGHISKDGVYVGPPTNGEEEEVDAA